jgi:colanic acid/amylovoran biosynthesis glycosyltransferase
LRVARRTTVAHYVAQYLPRTQTFIYQVLTHHRRYRPVVLAHERVEDAPLFPLRHVYIDSELTARRERSAWLSSVPGGWRFGPVLSFRHALRRYDARALHVHFGHIAADLLPLSRSLGIPQVTSFYGWDDTVGYSYVRGPERFARLFAEGDCFLVEGSHIAARLGRLGCPPEKIVLHRIGIDLDEVRFQPAHPPKPGEIVRVLICGRLIEKKGHHLALRAVASAKRRGFAVELRMIGDGELRSSLESEVSALGLDGAVRMLGSLSYEQYLSELAAAHAVLQPSLTAADGDTEGGAPTTLIEAQAAGKPIVTTLHADIPEIVVPGQSALLVPEADEGRLGEALVQLLSEPERWRDMGEAGRRHVESEHDIRRQVERLEDLYDSLCRGERSRPSSVAPVTRP